MPQFTDADKIFRMMWINTVFVNWYEIWRPHEKKRWKYCSVKRLVARYKEDRVERKTGPGLPRSTRTEETEETVENLIMSQEVQPHSHLSPRQIEKSEGISQSSVVPMVWDKSIDNFKGSYDDADE